MWAASHPRRADGRTMEIRFYIDPDTRLPRIFGHGVSEDEVEDVLMNPGEDRPGREGARIAIGRRSRAVICA